MEETRSALSTLKVPLLIGIYREKGEEEVCHDHLEELLALSDTYGFKEGVLKSIKLKTYDPGTYLTKGKLEEVKELLTSQNIDLVIFDEEIAPNQQRNLEKLFKKPVIDRTELILEVFAKRAKTKEARLQIELAKARYELPRLKRMWTHLSRQSVSGKGYLKGEGEKQIEIDRRLLKKRINSLKKEIDEVKKHREVQRDLRVRSQVPTFALVGYTNAGKSTLLNALTDAGVLSQDQLFATLDPVTRQYTLPNHQKVLLVDTVGFVRKLPHTVVAAFRSTLEEVLYTDIIIHLIDASHKGALEQAKTTYEVLKELGATKRPTITLLNKVDRCSSSLLYRLKVEFPNAVEISALEKIGFDKLTNRMTEELASLRQTLHLKVPQSAYGALSPLFEEGMVKALDYEGSDVLLQVTVPKEMIHKVERFIVQEENET